MFQLFWQLIDNSKAEVQGHARHFLVGGSSISLSVRREQLYSDAFSELASPDVGRCGYTALLHSRTGTLVESFITFMLIEVFHIHWR